MRGDRPSRWLHRLRAAQVVPQAAQHFFARSGREAVVIAQPALHKLDGARRQTSGLGLLRPTLQDALQAAHHGAVVVAAFGLKADDLAESFEGRIHEDGLYAGSRLPTRTAGLGAPNACR